MTKLLEIENLKTQFFTSAGTVMAVDDISYDVEEGETVAVVGESGCGKSVSALSVLRLIPWPPGKIVGGRIRFMGRDMLELSDDEVRKIRGHHISMVFQEPMTSLNPVLTIGLQLTETMQHHLGMSEAQAAERAAELLIADEPTTALDVTIQAQILELMKDLTRRLGVALIVITHNLGVVARYADRVNVMYAGKIIEMGDAQQIYHNPQHPYTLGLLASVPRMDQARGSRLVPIEGQPPDLTRLDAGCAFRPRCRFAIDRCAAEFPPLEAVEDGHLSACWRADELAELRNAS